MTLTRYLIAALVLYVLPIPSLSAQTCPAGAPRAAVIFGNGVNTLEEEVRKKSEQLRAAIEASLQPPLVPAACVDYEYAYANTNTIPLDLLEAAGQLSLEAVENFWRYWANLDLAPDWFQQAALAAFSLTNLAAYVIDSDLQRHVARYATLIQDGSKVVLVAHSQGNLYANEAHKLLFGASTLDPVTFSIVSVATPTSMVEGGGPWTTLFEDTIASIAFKIANPSVLPPTTFNVPPRCFLPWSCHAFVNYLNGTISGPRILDHILAAIPSLAVSLDDDFNAQPLNPTRWSPETPPPGFSSNVSVTNQRLEMTLGPGAGGAGIFSRCFVSGNFDVQVDYNLLSWPPRNPYGLRLGAVDLGVGPFGAVALQRNSSTVSSFEFYTMVLANNATQTPTTDLQGTLRLARSGPTLSGFFRSGIDWIPVGSGPSATIPTRFNLDVGTGDPIATGGILVAFDNFKVNAGAVVCSPFTATGSMSVNRVSPTSTLLPDGKVLVAGGRLGCCQDVASAELYDPATGLFTPTGSMTVPRSQHTATLLRNGKVLITGGFVSTHESAASAELYDPATGTFSPTGNMSTPRGWHTATLLPDGKVVVVGGLTVTPGTIPFGQATAEVYDPISATFTATGTMSTARLLHTATLLPNGKVLVAAGVASGVLASAELYDPATGLFGSTGSMPAARELHTATLLPNGKVLIAGGEEGVAGVPLASTLLYDPASGTFSPSGTMTSPRKLHAATALLDGRVLITGGSAPVESGMTAEFYEPVSGTFSATGNMTTHHFGHTATLLQNGTVLVAGGSSDAQRNAELFNPR